MNRRGRRVNVGAGTGTRSYLEGMRWIVRLGIGLSIVGVALLCLSSIHAAAVVAGTTLGIVVLDSTTPDGKVSGARRPIL